MKSIFLAQYSSSEFTEIIKQAVREVLSEQVIPANANAPPKVDARNFVSSKELCKLLSISLPTLIKYRQTGIIRGKKIGGKYYYKLSEIERVLTPSKR